MAEIIRPKFDVVRGWAGGGSLGSAYDKTFNQMLDSSDAPLLVKQGTFITYSSTTPGAMVPLVTATTTTRDDYNVWLVVEGNDPLDSFSGDFLNKCVAIKGVYEALFSSTMFTAGAYVPGAAVTVTAGKLALRSSTLPKLGYVTSYDSASGLLTCAFNL
jgi:hypothetical protein